MIQILIKYGICETRHYYTTEIVFAILYDIDSGCRLSWSVILELDGISVPIWLYFVKIIYFLDGRGGIIRLNAYL